MSTGDITGFEGTSVAHTPSLPITKKDIVCVVASVAGALIAATGIVTLVALALPNAGALNALCSLGPYGGSTLLAGGVLVTATALAVCLLTRVCSGQTPVHASESYSVKGSNLESQSGTNPPPSLTDSTGIDGADVGAGSLQSSNEEQSLSDLAGAPLDEMSCSATENPVDKTSKDNFAGVLDVGESEHKISDDYKTAIADVKKQDDENHNANEDMNYTLAIPVIKKFYGNPNAMDYLVEKYNESHRALAVWVVTPFLRDESEADTSMYNWDCNVAVFDAIRRSKDDVLFRIVINVMIRFGRTFLLFNSQITDPEAKKTVTLYGEQQFLTMVFSSLYSAMVDEESKEIATHVHALIFEKTNTDLEKRDILEALQSLEDSVSRETVDVESIELKRDILDAIQADIKTLPPGPADWSLERALENR